VREYNRAAPLVAIHIPKCAGRSAQQVFEGWFGDGFLPHYYHEQTKAMPKKYELHMLHSKLRPVLVHGHFNKKRGFGVEDYYPEVKQFVTILRDPLELTVSSYFYVKDNESDWAGNSPVHGMSLENFIKTTKVNMLNHFPREISTDNYKDIIEAFFVEVGIVEYLDESMNRMAKKLEMDYMPGSISHHNATKRNEDVGDLAKTIFRETHKLEFEVYEYILSRYRYEQ
jgi:hypothetical protein